MIKSDYDAAMDWAPVAAKFDSLVTRLANMSLTSAGLVIGSSAKTSVKIANTVTFLNNGSTQTTVGGATNPSPGIGQFYSKTTAEIPLIVGGLHDIPANANFTQERCYDLYLDNTGSASWVAGAISSGLNTALHPEWPSVALGGTASASIVTGGTPVPGEHYFSPIGGIRVSVVAGTVPFTAGTGNLDGSNNAGVSTQYYNWAVFGNLFGAVAG